VLGLTRKLSGVPGEQTRSLMAEGLGQGSNPRLGSSSCPNIPSYGKSCRKVRVSDAALRNLGVGDPPLGSPNALFCDHSPPCAVNNYQIEFQNTIICCFVLCAEMNTGRVELINPSLHHRVFQVTTLSRALKRFGVSSVLFGTRSTAFSFSRSCFTNSLRLSNSGRITFRAAQRA
jgi:hypothetical protein